MLSLPHLFIIQLMKWINLNILDGSTSNNNNSIMAQVLLYPLQVLSVDHSPLIDQILSLQEGEIKALKLLEVIADADEVESNTDD